MGNGAGMAAWRLRTWAGLANGSPAREDVLAVLDDRDRMLIDLMSARHSLDQQAAARLTHPSLVEALNSMEHEIGLLQFAAQLQELGSSDPGIVDALHSTRIDIASLQDSARIREFQHSNGDATIADITKAMRAIQACIVVVSRCLNDVAQQQVNGHQQEKA